MRWGSPGVIDLSSFDSMYLSHRLGLAKHQGRRASVGILAIFRRLQVIISDLLARDGVLVVKRHNSSVRPEHRVLTQLVRSLRVFRICLGHEGHVVGLGVRPALPKLGVPEGEVLQPEDLPHAILLDVLILVYAALPPLHQPTRVRVLDALVRAGGHHASESALGTGAFGVDVDDALDLGVIEEETVDWPVAAVHEGLREAADVEAADAVLAIVAAAEELNAGVRVVGVEVDNLEPSVANTATCNGAAHLLVQALVEIVAVLVLQLAHFLLV